VVARAAAAVGALLASCATTGGTKDAATGYPLVYEQDFALAESMADLVFSDALAWDRTDEGGPALELLGGGDYAPPHRSPREIALIADLLLRDFVLEVDLLQTGREYGHRDMCLFFGFVSPARYYYVHLASAPDAHAHNAFLVDDAPRRNLAPVMPAGVEWGDGAWHRVRLERTVADGAIRVFFDDMTRPTIAAADTTLEWGRVGFGSFDDSGKVARVRIWAPESRAPGVGDCPFGEK